MRFVEGSRGAVARGQPWSSQSSLQALNSDLPLKNRFNLFLHQTLESKTILEAGAERCTPQHRTSVGVDV